MAKEREILDKLNVLLREHGKASSKKNYNKQETYSLTMKNVELALGMDISAYEGEIPPFQNPTLSEVAKAVAGYFDAFRSDVNANQAQVKAVNKIQGMLGYAVEPEAEQAQKLDAGAPKHGMFEPKFQKSRKLKTNTPESER